VVSRLELVSRLEEQSETTPLVLVSAGPGWGKTTLLAQWAAHSQRPFAWVSIDGDDNDPVVLLTYIAVALDRVSPLDDGVFAALASPGASVEGTIVPRLGASLAAMEQKVVLALDDLHLVDRPACLDAIAMLAAHVPTGSQLVTSERGRPALGPGALRAHALTFEIGPDELRTDEAGARQILAAAGVDLPDEQIAELTEHTEGWPAGLYLAALSRRARRGRSNGAEAFSGSDRLVSEYLSPELLDHLSDDELRFLTRTAVLERMSGPLCDAVLRTSGSAAVLEALVRSNLFVVPLDADGTWYRYHHLFQDLLRSELTRTEPEIVAPLLERAIAWCEEHGELDTAVGYAQQAGDVERVVRLVERRALPVYRSGRALTAERWLAWLEANGALERYPAAAVLAGMLAIVRGRPVQADRMAEAAERASADGEHGELPDGSSSIDSWLAVLRALRCKRGMSRMREDAELAVRTLDARSTHRAIAKMLLAISQMLSGELEQADDLFADAVEDGAELGAHETVMVALAERAAMAIARGAWVQAEDFSDRAMRVGDRTRSGEYPTSAFISAVGARIALHRGDTGRGRELIARAQRLRARLTYAMPYLAIQTRLELARAYLAIADAGGARTVLREIDALLRRQPDLEPLAAQAGDLRSSLATMRAEAPGASTLTAAELRVVPYLATHLSFREMGERLYVSHHTVKSHAMAIYRKLNVTSRTSAVERAVELGLL
jgi:LuxR family maltose regulon positive regulatory protein